MKHHDKSKTKESLYLQYYDANSLYACAMTQKWPVVDFKFKKNIQKFTEDLDFEYPKHLHDLHYQK